MTKAILITDAGAVTAEPIQVHDAINMTLAFINGMVAQTAATMDEGEKETLFNALNESYSRSLEICFPEMELRPAALLIQTSSWCFFFLRTDDPHSVLSKADCGVIRLNKDKCCHIA